MRRVRGILDPSTALQRPCTEQNDISSSIIEQRDISCKIKHRQLSHKLHSSHEHTGQQFVVSMISQMPESPPLRT